MTRREFYKKFRPVADKWLEKYRGSGDAAVDQAYEIACVKETKNGEEQGTSTDR